MLISKGADVTYRNPMGYNSIMEACEAGLKPESIDVLLELWPEDYDWPQTNKEGESAFSLACESDNATVVLYLLQRCSNLSFKEKDFLWSFLSSELIEENAMELAFNVFDSKAANDLFTFEGFKDSDDVGTLLLDVDKLCAGAKTIHVPKTFSTFLGTALRKGFGPQIEFMETRNPSVVRPIVFLCLCGGSLGDSSEAVHAISERFKRDCMWLQVRDLFIAHVDFQNGTIDSHRANLADLPDACFERVVKFYQKPFDDQAAVEILCTEFCCPRNMIFSDCECLSNDYGDSDGFSFDFDWRFDQDDFIDYDSGGEGGYWLHY